MNLYKKYEVLSPIHHGGLTNHLPMVLSVLENLQVNSLEIERICDSYIDQTGVYELTDTSFPVSDFEQEYINKTNFFQADINNRGVDIVVGEFLNEHAKNNASALFHGIIRLSYALLSKNELYISQALSYFSLVSSETQTKGREVPLKEVTNHIESNLTYFTSIDYTFKSNRTMEKFDEILGFDPIRDNLVYPKNIEFNKEFVLDFVLSLFLRTNDFFILHLVTGFEAILSVEEFYIDFKNVLMKYFLDLQIFMLLNVNTFSVIESETKYDFDELKFRISELSDAHDIKLFHSLYILNKQFINDKLLIIANHIFNK